MYIYFISHYRHYSSIGHMGWVGGVPPGLPPGRQIDRSKTSLGEETSDEVRSPSLNKKM